MKDIIEFVKKHYIVWFNLALFIFAGFLAIYLIDNNNPGRMDFLENNIYVGILEMVGKGRISVTSGAYIYLCAYIFLMSLLIIGYLVVIEFVKKINKIFFHITFPVVAFVITLIMILIKSNYWNVIIGFIAFGILQIVCIYTLIIVIKYFGRFFVKNSNQTIEDKQEKNKEIFPALAKIDLELAHKERKTSLTNTLSLDEIARSFQNYLSFNHYYFDIKYLRYFIAGFSISRLLILEGLSGTGKTTLPRMWAKFLGINYHIEAIQSTYRDRTDLLGYYSDLVNQYKETEFLKTLYRADYQKNDINIMVLDEMNLSRIEYYFADFLSVLENPTEDWKLSLMQVSNDMNLPERLVDGFIKINTNTWFVGTANKDDSTYLITDKVYDRAMVIEFESRNTPLTVNTSADPISISSQELNKLFLNAQANEAYAFNEKDRLLFLSISDFVKDKFELVFGNRIMNQIIGIVPVYVACGGKKEEILDLMFANKVLRKLEGRYESYIAPGLNKLKKLIEEKYGPDTFIKTNIMIDKFLKKLS